MGKGGGVGGRGGGGGGGELHAWSSLPLPTKFCCMLAKFAVGVKIKA